jgi:tetratricopeptide (TPR) repeat protein
MPTNSFHSQAEIAREEDKHHEALQLIEAALVEYQLTKDYAGFAQALQSRCLTYKHLFLLHNDQVFALLAQHDAQASLAIAQLHDLKTSLGSSYFRLGEIAMLFDDYDQAVKYYQQALTNYHGTNCEKGDYQYHLGEALYRLGQKAEGKRELTQGLQAIQTNAHEVDGFLAHVWESGAHLRLAELLKTDEPAEARQHLATAEQIINADPKLIIRKRQLKNLRGDFGGE